MAAVDAAAAAAEAESSDSEPEQEHGSPQKLIRKVSTSGQIRSKVIIHVYVFLALICKEKSALDRAARPRSATFPACPNPPVPTDTDTGLGNERVRV